MDIVNKKEEYLVSKWLFVAALLHVEEMQALLEEVGHPLFFPMGKLVSLPAPVSFLEGYRGYVEEGKKLDPFLMTENDNDLYAMKTTNGAYLLYPKRPVIQVRKHEFIITQDGRIQSMVFGKESTPWGVIFSYPQIFYDPNTKKIVEVYKDESLPCTKMFRALQKWMREKTKPAAFIVQGKKVNATFRRGLLCSEHKMCMTSSCASDKN